ncbi:YhdP family protein [Pseudoxanthomonas suwonensis]|uniref:YhdP family protein n=1 Tax=Pseudoxanthomonas suwonensis TaxID=314722 RepID=UPI00048D0B99|nr:YhdP family protein [Pseudoxanthomonas suwonensis]
MPTPLRRRLRLARRWAAYLLAVVLVMMALVLGAVSQLLPLAERHPERVAAWLSEKAGRPVSFDRVRTQWTRRGPVLQLEGLHVGAPGAGVHVGQAEVLVSMYAGLLPGSSFTELRLRGPSLTLERDDDGRWSVRGLPTSGAAAGDPLEYLEGLGELQVIGGSLDVRAPQLGLRTRIPRIDLRLRVNGQRVDAGARAWIRPDGKPARMAFDFDRGSGAGRAWFGLDTEALGAWAPLLNRAGISVADGRGHVEAWAELRQHRVVLATTRFELRHLLLAGAPLADGLLPQVRLDELRGRARWRVTAQGWRLDVPQLQLADEHGAQSLDGLLLAGGQRYALQVERVDATPLLALAALSDALPSGLRGWLREAAPKAQVSALEVAGMRGGPMHAQGRLERIAFDPVGDAPGIDGLSGRFEGDGQGWQLALDPRSALSFDWPSGFGVLHELALDGTVLAWREGAGWEVGTPALRLDGGDYAADVRGGLWFQGDGTRPWIGIAADIDDAPVPVAKKFWVHHRMSEAAVGWLDMALEDGVVSGGRGLVAGDLDDWPFTGNNGRFEATAHIRDGRIRYQEDWPVLEALDAEVAFVGNGFSLQGQGTTRGLPIQRLQVGIADFSHAPLKVRASARGDAASMLELLRDSPLDREHHETFANLEASGPAATLFALDLPLGAGEGPARIDGTVALDGARLVEKRWNLAFDAVRGSARYDGNGFDAEELAVRYRGQDGVLALRAGGHAGDAANAFEASLQAPLDAADLFARAPELDWLAPRVQGRSPWRLDVALPKQARGDLVGTLQLQSSLAGTRLDLPSPLAKPATDTLATTVKLGLPLGSGPIDVAFGERMAVRARQRDGRTGVRVLLGASTVDAEPPTSGIVVGGRTTSLDALEWIGLAKGGGDGPALRQIDVVADELHLLGGVFPDTRLKLRPEAQALQVDVEGPALAGHVRVPDQSGATVEGRFSRFHWQPPAGAAKVSAGQVARDAVAAANDADGAGTDVPKPADDGFDPAAIPPLAMDIDDLRYRDAAMGRAVLRTRPVPGGLRVEQLQVQAGEQKIEASGEWLGRGEGARTHLALTVDSRDMGALMDSLGYRNWLARGEGRVSFDASWPGTPAGFRLGGLQGSLRIAARDGQLLEVEPGAGRVLGLFSLAQLPRRLMLDFRDFFSRGFAFDRLEANVRFADGEARTDDMLIEGPAADIRIRGTTDLRAQRFDQTIDVLPKSGNLLTVVGAVAGGPVGAAVGAAANAVLSKPLGGIGAKTYKVSGPWKEPKVEVIGREQSRREQEEAGAQDAGQDAG